MMRKLSGYQMELYALKFEFWLALFFSFFQLLETRRRLKLAYTSNECVCRCIAHTMCWLSLTHAHIKTCFFPTIYSGLTYS